MLTDKSTRKRPWKKIAIERTFRRIIHCTWPNGEGIKVIRSLKLTRHRFNSWRASPCTYNHVMIIHYAILSTKSNNVLVQSRYRQHRLGKTKTVFGFLSLLSWNVASAPSLIPNPWFILHQVYSQWYTIM
jgi:hypothetical protein